MQVSAYSIEFSTSFSPTYQLTKESRNTKLCRLREIIPSNAMHGTEYFKSSNSQQLIKNHTDPAELIKLGLTFIGQIHHISIKHVLSKFTAGTCPNILKIRNCRPMVSAVKIFRMLVG
jgi:hypothetical protein